MAKFEVVSKYKDQGLALPERKTRYSAGYDLAAAEDIIIPSYLDLFDRMEAFTSSGAKTLDQVAAITKALSAKPTLIPTGLKCELEPDTWLQLSIRSSSPLKYWLILANGIGVIDADYYNNSDNEGHIFYQVINLSPFPIKIQKGEIIGQAIILPYGIVENDQAVSERIGGFGSTTK